VVTVDAGTPKKREANSRAALGLSLSAMVAEVATQTVSWESRPQNGAEPTDQTRGFRSLSSRESVGFVEDQKIQACSGEQFDIPLAGEQQFKLFDVGEQNPWLTSRATHFVARADFFRRVNSVAAMFRPEGSKFGFVVGAGRAWRHAGTRSRVVRCLANVHAKTDAGAGQQRAEAPSWSSASEFIG
jgi:hypothetical protein